MAAASWLAFGTECWQAFFASIGHNERSFSPRASPTGASCKPRLASRARSAAARRWPGPCKPPVALIAAGAIALLWRSDARTRSKPPRLAAASARRRHISIHTTWWCSRCRWRFCFALARTHGFLQHELAGIGLACLLRSDLSLRQVSGRLWRSSDRGRADRLAALVRRKIPRRLDRTPRACCLVVSRAPPPFDVALQQNPRHTGVSRRLCRRRCATSRHATEALDFPHLCGPFRPRRRRTRSIARI